jgi:hypothetical protein
MKKIICAALILIFLSGCQLGLFQRKETMRLPEVRTGTQGVELFFTPGSPQPEVYEGSSFTALMTLSNLGAADVEDGVYSISYEPQYLYLPRQQNIGRFAVRGKSEFNPQGQERQLSFTFNTKPLGPQIQGYTTTIAFNACYPYTTTAPIIVCIDTDLTGKKQNKVCTSKSQTIPQGQGAPVGVTSVEQRMLPHDMQGKILPEFVLTLKNLGKGGVTASQLYREACSGRPLGEEGWNVVSVNAALSDAVMKCAPATIKLKQEGDTKVVCRLEGGIDARLGTYTAPLQVTLDYGYISSISTQVKIIKTG